ncbi:MAG: transaldolase, partial [Candidatus Eisenbacteria bacterium]|nr:transaldolase [Candidatus Eisenbacteria bacterium]
MSAALRTALGVHQHAVSARLVRFTAEDLAGRLAGRDATIWSTEPAHIAVARNRLGWIESPGSMRARVSEFEAFANAVASEGFTHALLLGMGGSSLAPEVLRQVFGVAAGRLEVAVLDNTSPTAVAAAFAAHDPRRTLVLVASKSGGTLEVASFEKRAFEWMQAARGDQAGRAFVAITDPGTSLGQLAATRGYRHTFENPADIGGRYSALSCFGIVPAALLGVPLAALLDSAIAELDVAKLERDAARNAPLALGAALGELALVGRDKVTLVLGGGFDPHA